MGVDLLVELVAVSTPISHERTGQESMLREPAMRHLFWTSTKMVEIRLPVVGCMASVRHCKQCRVCESYTLIIYEKVKGPGSRK